MIELINLATALNEEIELYLGSRETFTQEEMQQLLSRRYEWGAPLVEMWIQDMGHMGADTAPHGHAPSRSQGGRSILKSLRNTIKTKFRTPPTSQKLSKKKTPADHIQGIMQQAKTATSLLKQSTGKLVREVVKRASIRKSASKAKAKSSTKTPAQNAVPEVRERWLTPDSDAQTSFEEVQTPEGWLAGFQRAAGLLPPRCSSRQAAKQPVYRMPSDSSDSAEDFDPTDPDWRK